MLLPEIAISSENEFQLPDDAQTWDPGIFVTGEGIRRVNSVTLATQWHALKNIQTFNPVILDKQVIVGSSSGLFAIDKEDGTIRWSIKSEDSIYTPVVTGNTAYTGGQSGVVMAVNIHTGATTWRVMLDGWVYPPAVSRKYIIAGGSAHRVVALDRHSGNIEWELELDQELVYRPVTVAEERVAITTFANETILINSQDGKVIWTYLDNAPSFSPHVISDQLVSGMLDGRIRSLDLTNGRLIWENRTGGHPQINVYPAINALVVANGEGVVIGLDSATGNTLWKRVFIKQVKGTFQAADNRINVLLADKFNNTWSIDVIEQGNFTSGGQNEM